MDQITLPGVTNGPDYPPGVTNVQKLVPKWPDLTRIGAKNGPVLTQKWASFDPKNGPVLTLFYHESTRFLDPKWLLRCTLAMTFWNFTFL